MTSWCCAVIMFLFVGAASAADGQLLPGTRPLEMTGDLSVENLVRIDRFLERAIDEAVGEREQRWQRDYSSREAYAKSVRLNRHRLRQKIGAVDPRKPPNDLQLVATLNRPALVAESEQVKVYAVRWSALAGVDGEGLLIEPATMPRAIVIAVPDADWTPEMVAGLDAHAPRAAGFGRRLAEAGCRVLVPTLIDRNTRWSGNPRVRMLNQTHREFIYRQAFFMGRHLVGYEVQKVQAAVDYFQARPDSRQWPIGVAGYGEGGLVAFYAAAIDDRIDATLVSGYFQPRESMHSEPVYRNVYGLLREFGDSDIASLIAPRKLIVEASRAPAAPDPPPQIKGLNFAAYGKLSTPAFESVVDEFARAQQHYRRLHVADNSCLIPGEKGSDAPMSEAALRSFADALGARPLKAVSAQQLRDRRGNFDPLPRQRRQFDQLIAHTQQIVKRSPLRRAEFWSAAESTTVARWQQTSQRYRQVLWDEVIGRLPAASLPANPRTRQIYRTSRWTGYEVVLDVYPDVFTYGILLLPKNIKPGEKRPVVVAQHGRNGRPQDICSPDVDTPAYHSFGARLADLGFIVYAPQNLYIGEERYRTVQRKAFALGMTFFAPMVRQHEQVLKWLSELPQVDAKRIGFYGLSYGGKSAMLIPAVLEGYALSICSGDFNEQVWKHTSIDDRYSFMFTLEHEHAEFDFGERFNYAEIASLLVPRPFMVERGHHDGVAPDEWVAYEYAKVRRLYVVLGIGDRTTIEFFDGRHEINARGSFKFLAKHLNWPGKSDANH